MNSTTEVKISLGCGLSSKDTKDNSIVDFEKAISLTGFGKFHYWIIFLCGIIFCCAGFQNGLNAYVMPSAECDLKMTSTEKGLLNAVFLGGGLASAFFWGVLADHIGRKKVLVFSLILDAITTIISSFSQTFFVFAVFRFLNGFLIGGPGSIVVAYLGEFLANKQRPPSLCAMGFFWTVSWMILPAAALGIMPITWAYRTEGFIYNSWRIYVMIFAIPTLISGIVLAVFFPESPKFLFSQGRNDEALKVLTHMFEITYGKKCGEYPVKIILPEENDETTATKTAQNGEKNVHPTKDTGFLMYQILKQVWEQITSLFQYPTIYSTILGSSLLFSNMFGYYGLGLWLPELFNRFEDHYKVSNVSATVCEVTYKNLEVPLLAIEPDWFDSNSTNHTLQIEDCSNTAINPTVFLNTFIIGASCLIGNILSAILAKPLGLKFLTILTALVSGICAITIYFLKTPSQNLLMSCLFLTFVGAENVVISSAIVDLFPTNIRALAVCTAIFSGRLGAVASNLTLGYVLDISCEIPIFLMGFILLCGCFLGFLLPKNSESDKDTEKT